MFDVWMTGVLGHAVTRDYRAPRRRRRAASGRATIAGQKA